MTPAQARRKELEYLTGLWAKENGVDPASLMLLTKEIVMSCVDEGVRSERINMKSPDDGVSTLTERFPAVAISGINLIHNIQQSAIKELQQAEPPDAVTNVIMNPQLLENML